VTNKITIPGIKKKTEASLLNSPRNDRPSKELNGIKKTPIKKRYFNILFNIFI
jgi:hypothetical protein